MEHKGGKLFVLLAFSLFIFILWIFLYPVIQNEMNVFHKPQPENQTEQRQQVES